MISYHRITGRMPCGHTPVFRLLGGGRFGGFRLTGATRCTDGGRVKFGVEKLTEVPLKKALIHASVDSSAPNFTPIGAGVEVWAPKALNFTKSRY